MDPKRSLLAFHADVVRIVRKAWPKLVRDQIALIADRVVSGKPVKRSASGKPVKRSAARSKPATTNKLVKRSAARSKPATMPSLSMAVEQHGSKRAAAKWLGISESTLRDRLKKEMASAVVSKKTPVVPEEITS